MDCVEKQDYVLVNYHVQHAYLKLPIDNNFPIRFNGKEYWRDDWKRLKYSETKSCTGKCGKTISFTPSPDQYMDCDVNGWVIFPLQSSNLTDQENWNGCSIYCPQCYNKLISSDIENQKVGRIRTDDCVIYKFKNNS